MPCRCDVQVEVVELVSVTIAQSSVRCRGRGAQGRERTTLRGQGAAMRPRLPDCAGRLGDFGECRGAGSFRLPVVVEQFTMAPLPCSRIWCSSFFMQTHFTALTSRVAGPCRLPSA